MKIFLKLKHWQLFSLMILPFILMEIELINIMRNGIDSVMNIIAYPIVMIFSFAIFMSWFYGLGKNLYKKLPESVEMNLTKFKILFFIPVIYISGIILFAVAMAFGVKAIQFPDNGIILIIIPLHLLSMFGMFYCLYFNAKTMKSVEWQRPVTFSDYAGEFFLIWFFPLGIWFIQPRINKLFAETQENSADEIVTH